ncbi:MAG TPA: response regulator [Candidatus Aminicenantes bacterium]|nr:response regulator [Candidatus Aminicenantes bacterium]
MKKPASQKHGGTPQKQAGAGAKTERQARSGERHKVESELNLYRDQLEELVSERTLALELANRQLEEEIDERRQSELLQSALFQIAGKASQAEDLGSLYASVHRIVSTLLYARNFYIALLDPEGDVLRFPYFIDEFDAPPGPQKLGRGLTEYVLRSGQPLLVSDQQVEQMAAEGLVDLIGSPSCEWLGVPLKRGERTFGVLVIQSYQEDFHYSERDRELLIFVSQHIADALWRKQAERELRDSQRFLEAVFNGIQDGISVLDGDLNILQVNQAMNRLYAHQLPLAGKKCFQAYHGRSEPCRVCPTLRALRERSPQVDVVPLVGGGGQSGWLELHSFPLADADGETTMVIEYVRDISERKLLEERFIQAQKMESIGLLAGGIAHDFNNILGGILGYASWLKTNIQGDHPFFRPVDTIEKSARRAAELTAQLLAFARGGKYDLRPCSLNGVVGETLRILSGTFDKSIVIETDLDGSLPTVEIDASQIQQVLMNLCVNARDAMPGGGRLIIQSSVARLSESDARHQPDAKPGWFAVLAVSDTGVGMEPAVKGRIFEPFFTTKEKGKGTGLGLSMVYGVVKNHGGFVNVYSEPGQGSTFKIYLPLSGKPEAVESAPERELAGGDEEILVIDDEEAIRQVAADILGSYGYRVSLAADGAEGVALFRKNRRRTQMVLLDMVMPRQGGRETFLQLQEIDPQVRVLFSTGYSQNEKVNEIMALGVRGFIQKPYQVRDLLAKVREVLDGKP